MPRAYLKDKDGNLVGLSAIKGEDGKDGLDGKDGKGVTVGTREDFEANEDSIINFDPNEVVVTQDYYTKLQSDVKYAKDIDVGDISKFPVKVDSVVDALVLMQGGFMKNFTYADKNIIIDYRNGAKFIYDVSPIITDASIGEFKDVNLANIKDGESLVYSSARKTFIGKAIDSSAMLEEAKTYADELVKKINKAPSMVVDEKPTYDESTHTTTYKKNGETHTTTDSTNFYYKVGEDAWTSIWIDDIEFSSALHGTVDFSEYISRETDLTDTIETVNLSLIPTMKAVKELIEFAQEGLGDKVNTADIVDNLTSSDATRPLSANQGRVLHELVTGVSGKIVYADTENTDEAKAIAELPTAEKVKADYVSKDMVVDDLGFTDDEDTTTFALADDDAIPTVGALRQLHTLLFKKFMQIKNIIKKDDTETVSSDDNVYSASKVDDKLSKKLNGTAIPSAFIDTLVGTSGTPTEFAEKLKEYTGLNTAIYYRFSTSSNRDVLYNYGLIPISSNYYIELHIIGTTTNFYITATKQNENKNYIRNVCNGVAQEWQELATTDSLNAVINFKGYNNTLSKVDLNEYNIVGSYVVLEDCDNLPYNNAGWFFMNVYGGGNGGVVQEIINNYNSEKLYRTFNGFDWTDWQKLVTKENAVVKNFRIANDVGTATIIPWNDGTHFRNIEGDINTDYTELCVSDGRAMLYELRDGVSTVAQELATASGLADKADKETHVLNTYNSVRRIGITNETDVQSLVELAQAIPDHSIWLSAVSSSFQDDWYNKGITPVKTTGMLQITKRGRLIARFTRGTDTYEWINTSNDGTAWNGWKQLATMEEVNQKHQISLPSVTFQSVDISANGTASIEIDISSQYTSTVEPIALVNVWCTGTKWQSLALIAFNVDRASKKATIRIKNTTSTAVTASQYTYSAVLMCRQ